MSPVRFVVLAVAVAALAAPLSSAAAPAGDSTAASCAAQRMTLTERRISEEAAKGLPSLISFVNLTQPIYQLRVVDAVAWIDAQRERRNACVTMSARSADSD